MGFSVADSARSNISYLIRGLICVFLAISLSGVNYCQRSYNFGSQTTLNDTPTPTPDDNDVVTRTPTASPTATETPEPDVTGTATATPTPDANTAAAQAFFRSLADLDNAGSENPSAASVGQAGDSKARMDFASWLGQIGSEAGGVERVLDSDVDGFTDALEIYKGSNPSDLGSVPPPPAANLQNRFIGIDDDVDGIVNDDEARLGTNPTLVDSDSDGLSDGREVELGSNPLVVDTDGDGILDGKEVQLSSDPVVANN